MMMWKKNLPEVIQSVAREGYLASFLSTVLHTSALFGEVKLSPNWLVDTSCHLVDSIFCFHFHPLSRSQNDSKKGEKCEAESSMASEERWRSSKACGQVAALGGGPRCWPWRSCKQPRGPFSPPWLPLLISSRHWLPEQSSNALCSSDLNTAQEKHSVLSSTWWLPQRSPSICPSPRKGVNTQCRRMLLSLPGHWACLLPSWLQVRNLHSFPS